MPHRRSCRRLGPGLAALVAVGVAAMARGGTALRVEQPPGTDDLRIWWESDAASPGPHALLRREVAPGASVAAALPLDPIADAWIAALAAPPLDLPAEAAVRPGSESTTVYQLVDAAGGCSNAAYVVRRPATGSDSDPSGSFARAPSIGVQFPPWPAMPDARALFTHWPALLRASANPLVPCRRVELERDGAGGLVGPNFGLAGRAVELYFGGSVAVVLAGASDPADPDIALSDTPLAPCTWVGGDVQLSPATRWRAADELACGVEGLDWIDGDGDTLPDTCVAGLFSGASLFRVDASVPAPGAATSTWIPRLFAPPDAGLRQHGTNWPHVPGQAVRVLGAPDCLRASLPGRDAGAAASCRCPDADGDGRDDCTERLEGTDPLDAASVGPDTDRDGIPDRADACPLDPDPLQADEDGDGAGDACDPCLGDAADACVDPDGDGLPFGSDNCPTESNADQANGDGDRFGDACDTCPLIAARNDDLDGDGIGDACDACPSLAGAPQDDADRDGAGDACDCSPADAALVAPAEVTGLRVRRAAAGALALAWNDTLTGPAPAEFEVLGGSLDELRADAGYARAACVAAHLATAGASVAAAPGPGWYLARAVGDCGLGTFGDARAPLADPRDAIDVLAPCP